MPPRNLLRQHARMVAALTVRFTGRSPCMSALCIDDGLAGVVLQFCAAHSGEKSGSGSHVPLQRNAVLAAVLPGCGSSGSVQCWRQDGWPPREPPVSLAACTTNISALFSYFEHATVPFSRRPRFFTAGAVSTHHTFAAPHIQAAAACWHGVWCNAARRFWRARPAAQHTGG